MNSEYHKLPVSKTKKRIYNENREAKKPLHIEGGSSCTDAERLNQEILSEFQKLQENEKSFILSFARSLILFEQGEAFSDLRLIDRDIP